MLIVLGSINADLLFKVESLPRPGETVLCPGYERAPGGKGANQAAAAAKAGARVRFVGHVGADDNGSFARAMLDAAGVDTAMLATSPRPTAVAVIGVDQNGENQIIVASGANLDTAAGQLDALGLGPGTTLLCQNEIRSEESFTALRRARAAGARTILTLAPAAPVPADVLDALDVLVVNELEAEAAAGGPGDPLATARRLARAHGLACVVTLGAAGALAVAGDTAWRIGSLPIRPVDTTGAGDAFVGVLAACLDAGEDLPAALRRAAVGAGLACEAVGAQTSQPSRAQIDARLGELAAPVRID
jgi:ribokinase